MTDTNTDTQGSLLNSQDARPESVECLGLQFENDGARRAYFLKILKDKLQNAQFRHVDGFPIGSDEDILELSDPPYYTACPNPFTQDFLDLYARPYDASQPYHREPFAADVREGRGDPIYLAHSYHTKVPHKAIMRYILHYTQPGDVILDGFCGTGMTAVAAQLCGDRSAVQALGYRVEPDGLILEPESDQGETVWREVSRLGPRRAILNDLSPAATFIAYSYNRYRTPLALSAEATSIIDIAEREFAWMYQTLHRPTAQIIESAQRVIDAENVPDLSLSGPTGRINYIVWSDVFFCPECAKDFVFWNVAVDKDEGKVRDVFQCPHCDASLGKKNLKAKTTSIRDRYTGSAVTQRVQVPAYINYTFGKKRFEKFADLADRAMAMKIEAHQPKHWFPTFPLKKGDKTGEPFRVGITHTHHFYTSRILHILSRFRSFGLETWPPFSALTPRATKMHRIAASRIGGAKQNEGGATVGVINGTLYVPSLSVEMNVLDQATERIRAYSKAWFSKGDTLISTQSSTSLRSIPSNSLDYVFIDPPFGSNLMYSELNSLWEGWLRVFTQDTKEAIENSSQRKTLDDYRLLMAECFHEIFRILKPGRWVTIEFSNTQASVWNSIQVALQEAGLVVANVAALDKKQGSFNAVTNPTSVKQDLVISAYKPNGGLEERFRGEIGMEESAWDFTRTHLAQLPVFLAKHNDVEIVAERQGYALFDRMVAFHVLRGVTVPISASEYYVGLSQRFPERDGMYFLSDQVAEYDKKRMQTKEIRQLEIFVRNESSAIQWLRQQLLEKPQTFQEVHPHFIRELTAWDRHERPVELAELLDQNFLCYEGQGDVPTQIHGYLSTNFHDLRNLPKDAPALRKKAKDKYYVADPAKESDVQQTREKALLREFEEYRVSKQKRLSVFRLEAIRAGFRHAWQHNDYTTIMAVAEKIPEDIVQEDPMLLMWYSSSITRGGRQS
jgi:DNA modification methylase